MAASDRHATRGRRAGAWLVEILAWTLLLWGAWLLSLSAVGPADALVGGLSALAAAVFAAVARRAIRQRWRPTWTLFTPLAALPAAIAVDTVAVLLSPWRAGTRRGELQTVDVAGEGRGPRAAARRAVITTIVSTSPATVVLDADDETGRVVVHALRSPGPSLHDRYARR